MLEQSLVPVSLAKYNYNFKYRTSIVGYHPLSKPFHNPYRNPFHGVEEKGSTKLEVERREGGLKALGCRRSAECVRLRAAGKTKSDTLYYSVKSGRGSSKGVNNNGDSK
jgi:hypothetical protein